MQQQDKACSLESTVTKPSPVSAEEEAGSSSGCVARCLPSPLAELAGQDHPQSGDAHDAGSHAAQLGSISQNTSPDSDAQKGVPSCALHCPAPLPSLPLSLSFCLPCPALALALPCPALALALPLTDGQLKVTWHMPHHDSQHMLSLYEGACQGMGECRGADGEGGGARYAEDKLAM